jgi:hypothetical protein
MYCHMNRIRIRSSCSKLQKPDCPVWQTGWSSFVDSNDSQGHHWHSMMELLLRPSDVWMEDSQERQESKGLKWQILDLIDEKKEN